MENENLVRIKHRIFMLISYLNPLLYISGGYPVFQVYRLQSNAS